MSTAEVPAITEQAPDAQLRKLADPAPCALTFDAYNNLRHSSRQVFARAVNSGALLRQPCQVCGNSESEGHHPDYRLPLAVDWLCRKHHREAHTGHSHTWQFLGADSRHAPDALEEDLVGLAAVREEFRNAKGKPCHGYANWIEYVHNNSRLSLRSIQYRLSKVYGRDERKINHRFKGVQ
jgi:hypothetical protein